MLCHLCSQLERYAYLDGNNTCHSLPDYNLKHLYASDKCDLCQLLLFKALLYPQVREDGIHLGVTSGKALWLAENGTDSAIYSNSFPLCTLPYPTGDSLAT